jgi:SpoIID/LytB domain protein
MEAQPAVEVELIGGFTDAAGKAYDPGRYRFTSEITLVAADASCAFALGSVTIGIGFHWERKQRQVFRGNLRIIKRAAGLTVVNEVPLEEYVISVISSEMSASCPLELLKAHAVISRSWLLHQKRDAAGASARQVSTIEQSAGSKEIVRWYGREAHPDFDVCADDHCQRYQGITQAFSDEASTAVNATRGEFLVYAGEICDARFSKCCGGITEEYATAWDDRHVPYLTSVVDGRAHWDPLSVESFIRSQPPAYCNTQDAELLARILPGFDQETRDFYRWHVEYSSDQLRDLLRARLGVDLGRIRSLESLARGPSGRIYRLKITGDKDEIVIGKELEIRRALSATHLYSSAFVVDRQDNRFLLRGAGWGHGVGLCQIGAAVMASEAKNYRDILAHYYRGAQVHEAL